MNRWEGPVSNKKEMWNNLISGNNAISGQNSIRVDIIVIQNSHCKWVGFLFSHSKTPTVFPSSLYKFRSFLSLLSLNFTLLMLSFTCNLKLLFNLPAILHFNSLCFSYAFADELCNLYLIECEFCNVCVCLCMYIWKWSKD